MRRIIASEFISADGYIVGPGNDMSWVMNNFNEEMGKYAGDLMQSMDTVMLGRVTYEIMVNAWPNLTEQQSPGADKMNSVPKVVLSRTLKEAPWGGYKPATIIRDDVERRINELKQKPGKNIAIYGSANLVQNRHSWGSSTSTSCSSIQYSLGTVSSCLCRWGGRSISNSSAPRPSAMGSTRCIMSPR